MPTATALTADYVAKHQQLSDFFTQYKSSDLTPEQVEKVREWNVELNDIGTRREKALEVESIESKTREIGTELARPVGRPSFGSGESKAESLSFGQAACSVLYGKDGRFIRANKGQEMEVENYRYRDAEYKTTLTTSGGFPPEARRSGRLELSLQVPLMVVDMLPTIPVPMGTYTYMQETTFTNSAAGIAETGTYPESALAYTPVTATVTKIGTFIPVTEEQLSDQDGMRSLINNRLQLMVNLEVENEVLNGTGSSNTINGFLNQVTQAQAKSTDPVFDATLKAMTLVRTVGMAEPDLAIFNPTDWMNVRLARTEMGLYIMGNPDQVGLDRLFGMRIMASLKEPLGTALVGAFQAHSALITRWGMDVQASNSDGTDFIKDIIKVKARVRLGLGIFRLPAFCKITGL